MRRAKANHATDEDPEVVWLERAEGGGYATAEAPPPPQAVGKANRERISALVADAGSKGLCRKDLEEATGLKKSAVCDHLNALGLLVGKDKRYRLSVEGDREGQAASNADQPEPAWP